MKHICPECKDEMKELIIHGSFICENCNEIYHKRIIKNEKFNKTK